jgi:hypothetical protein
MYYVEVEPARGRGRVKHYQKGGGKYTSLKSATDQRAKLARAGVVAKLYVGQVTWEAVPVEHFHLPEWDEHTSRYDSVTGKMLYEVVPVKRCNCGLDVIDCIELDGKLAPPRLF